MTKLDVARKLQHVVELLDRSPAADGRSQDAALYLRVAIALLVSEEESHADGVERLPSAPPIAQHDLVSLALDPGLPTSGSAPGFDPVKMSLDLIRLVNGPGGTVEQTYLYLDRQSAADWLSICSTESFAESYRKTPLVIN